MPIDVAKEERPTIDPAIPTAFALNSRAARPQKTKPRTALPMLPASTQPPCSRTRAASEIPPVERTGFIQGNSQPSMTLTKDGNVGGPDKDYPNWRRGADFLRRRRSGYVCPLSIQATFTSWGRSKDCVASSRLCSQDAMQSLCERR